MHKHLLEHNFRNEHWTCLTVIFYKTRYILNHSIPYKRSQHDKDLFACILFKDLSSRVQRVISRRNLTLSDTAAETTLEPPSTFNELHKRAHVSFAPITSDRTRFSMVYQIRKGLWKQEKKTWKERSCHDEKVLSSALCGHFYLPVHGIRYSIWQLWEKVQGMWEAWTSIS